MSRRRLFALCLRRVAETGLSRAGFDQQLAMVRTVSRESGSVKSEMRRLTVGIGMRRLREAMERLSLSTRPKECASPQLVHLASHLAEG